MLSRTALIALTGLSLPLTAARDETRSADPLQPFARFVGGAWESEGDVKVRVVYDWGVNHKALTIKSYLIGKDGPRHVYDSTVYWHPAKKHVAFQSVSAQGNLFDGVMTVDGNTYTSVFTSYEGDKITSYRQTLEFTDDDHVTWTVFGKEGDGWVTLRETKQSRVKPPET